MGGLEVVGRSCTANVMVESFKTFNVVGKKGFNYLNYIFMALCNY